MHPAASPRASVRHEIKFAVPAFAGGQVEAWLCTSALAFRQAHPPRQVNNLYFDTPDAEAMADKLAGISDRAKVRYRWYGDGDVWTAGRLEVKRRHNGVGWKEAYAVTAPADAPTRAAFVRSVRALLPPAARRWLDRYPVPMLITRYRRAYYVSADGAVRATVDRDLVVFDQRSGRFPQFAHSAALDLVVLELKLPLEERARVARELGEFGFVTSACSKYELGMRAIAGL